MKPVAVRIKVPITRGLFLRKKTINYRQFSVIDKYMNLLSLTELKESVIVKDIKPSNMIGIRKGASHG